jgi:hypothetical protein
MSFNKPYDITSNMNKGLPNAPTLFSPSNSGDIHATSDLIQSMNFYLDLYERTFRTPVSIVRTQSPIKTFIRVLSRQIFFFLSLVSPNFI